MTKASGEGKMLGQDTHLRSLKRWLQEGKGRFQGVLPKDSCPRIWENSEGNF